MEAARAEVAAAASERDAARASLAAAEATLAEWQQSAAASQQQAAALAEARAQAEAARHEVLQLQLAGAADAQRWEEQLLSQQRQLDAARQAAQEAQWRAEEQARGAASAAASAAAQQQLLQGEVEHLRQLLSAKDQQIGALSGSRPSSAGSADGGASGRQAQRLQAQVRRLA